MHLPSFLNNSAARDHSVEDDADTYMPSRLEERHADTASDVNGTDNDHPSDDSDEGTTWDERRTTEQQRFIIANRDALLTLGRSMPTRMDGRTMFTNAGCIATLLGIIDREPLSRDDIMCLMRGEGYTYRHTGRVLSLLTGTDPDQHFWTSEEGEYRLLAA